MGVVFSLCALGRPRYSGFGSELESVTPVCSIYWLVLGLDWDS